MNPFYNVLHLGFPTIFLLVLMLLIFITAGGALVKSVIERFFPEKLFRYSSQFRESEWLPKFFEKVDHSPHLSKNIPGKIDLKYFLHEDEFSGTFEEREEHILEMMNLFEDNYNHIWTDLSAEEQYVLFDLSVDGYTNYKNANTIFKLLTKGILIYSSRKYRLQFFSLSFRNFVLSKKGSPEIADLLAKFAAKGTWESIRLPVVIMVGVAALFLVITQNEVTQEITAFIASIGALIPLALRLFERRNNKSS